MNGFRSHHAFVAGFIGGLVLDQVTFAVLLIGIVVGAFGGFVVRNGLELARWVGRRLDSSRPFNHGGRPW